MSEQVPPEFIEMLKQAWMQQQMGGQEQELAAYRALGPEGFRAHSNLGTNDERGALAAAESRANQDMVTRQLAQAQELGQPQGKNYGTVAGNIAGGLGDIARQVGGGIRTHQLQGQQAELMKRGQADQLALLKQKDDVRAASGTAQMEAFQKLRDAYVARQQGAMTGQPGRSGFGLQGLQSDPSLSGQFAPPQAQQPMALPGMAQTQPRRRLGPGEIPLPDPSFFGL